MRKRITALLLTITVLAMSLLPTIITGTAAADTTQLIANGNFAQVTGNIPDGWTYTGGSIANLSAGIDTTDKSPDGSNSFKFTQTAATNTMAYFYYNQPIALKTNCDYTLTMWVKSSGIKSLRFYLYEPSYVARDGSTKYSDTPVEGGNIYTYSYDSGSTRVIRTHIVHNFKFNDIHVLSDRSSMLIVRNPQNPNEQLDVSADFPGQTRTNEWVKLTYTFSTTSDPGDVANVRFAVGLKDGLANSGTAAIADISFTEYQRPFTFAPQVNDADLGGVFPKSVELFPGKSLTFMATPTDGNTFVNWTLNGQVYSTNPVITGTFSETDVLKANFAAGPYAVTNAGAEKYSNNQNVAPFDSTTQTFTGDWILFDFQDYKPAGSWVTAIATNAMAHYGKQSVVLNGRYQINTRRITGLEKNKDYILSFWYYLPKLEPKPPTFNFAAVVPPTATTVSEPTAGGAALAYANLNKDATGEWTCVTIPFNSQNNTEVYVTTKFSSDIGSCVLYLDDFGVYEGKGDIVNVSVQTSPGGKAYVSRNGSAVKGSTVMFYAVPNSDASFLGWYDANGNQVSTLPVYVTTVNADTNLVARFDYVKVGIDSVSLGGTATSSHTGYVPQNTEVTFTATPNEGNTFKGWYDAATNTLVSTNPVYTVNVTSDTVLNAYFEGYNKPARELLKNGSFETGTITGWFADDPNYGDSVGWCSWNRSDIRVYEGNYSLRVYARHRNSILPLNNLTENTTYRISFYYFIDEYGTMAQNLQNVFIGPPGTTDMSDATVMQSVKGPIKAGPGWNRFEMYFNSGNNTTINLGLRYHAEAGSNGNEKDAMYIDNLELYEYSATPEILNGDFSQGKVGYSGSFNVTGSKEASLEGASAKVAQTVAVKPYTDYRVTFRAKTSGGSTLKAAAVDLAKDSVTDINLINSYSYVDVTGTSWTEYSFVFFSGIHQAVKLLFENQGTGTTLLDNIAMVEESGAAQGMIDYIDFETDRFTINDYYTKPDLIAKLENYYIQSDAFEIYTKQGASDNNVRSGNKSLRIKYNEATNGLEKVLHQPWTTIPVEEGGNYVISLWYRTVEQDCVFRFAPDNTGMYTGEEEYLSNDTEWTKLSVRIANTNGLGYLRMILGNVAYSTKSDVYIDDIIVQVSQPMVTEENTRLLYTEQLYNAVKNPSFEKPTTDADWGKTLPSNFKIIDTTNSKTDSAPNLNKYLRVTAGQKYVLGVETKIGVEHGFGVFIRGKAGTNAYIGLTSDAEGNNFFVNDEEQPASKVTVTATDGEWHRAGFKFLSTGKGVTYIVIDVKEGYLDIDNVMIFPVDYGYRYDPNDYSVYNPDYDNIKYYYINGGEGPQPYAPSDDKGNQGGDGGNDDSNPKTEITSPLPWLLWRLQPQFRC